MPEEQSTLLNAEVFRQYVSADDERMRGRVISLFESQVMQYLEELESALTDGDVDAIGRVLHKMKGTTAFIGASYLHSRVVAIMGEPDEKRADKLRRSLDSLRAGLRETVAVMQTFQ